MTEKTCNSCIHFGACSKWTDFPKQCGVPVCASFAQQSEWISVDDRMPDELKKPILVTDGEKVIVAYRNWLYRSNSTGELRCPANYGNGMKVTHWMPLPSAPKGE